MGIPDFGITGEAISALLVQFSSTILANVFLSRTILRLQFKSLFLIK